MSGAVWSIIVVRLFAPSAFPDSVHFEWRAPPGCPDEEHVRNEIGRLAGAGIPALPTASSSTAAATLTIRTSAAHVPPKAWRLRIRSKTSRSPVRERIIDGESCEALAHAAAMVVVMAIPSFEPNPSSEPDSSFEHHPSPGPAGPAPSSSLAITRPVVSTASAATVAQATPVESLFSGLDLRLRGAVGSELGSRPSASFGAGVALAVTSDHVRVEAVVTRWLATTELIPGTQVGGDFALLAIGARGCIALPFSDHFGGNLCAGPELGWLSVRSRGTASPYSDHNMWWAGSLGSLFAYRPSTRFSLVGGMDLSFPFTRHRFLIETLGELYRPKAVSIRLTVGAELRIL